MIRSAPTILSVGSVPEFVSSNLTKLPHCPCESHWCVSKSWDYLIRDNKTPFSKVKGYCVSPRYKTARSEIPVTYVLNAGKMAKDFTFHFFFFTSLQRKQGWVVPNTVPQLIKPDSFKYPREKSSAPCIAFYYHYPYLYFFLLRHIWKQHF